MRHFYKLSAFGWSVLMGLLLIIELRGPSVQAQPTITPVPTSDVLLFIGSEPYICLPIKTVLALTASPTFVGPTPTRIPSSTPTPLSECAQSGIVTATTLNVRAGPGAEFAVIGSLKLNDVVTIAESKDVTRPDGTKTTWLRLCANQLQWINAAYVRLK